MNQTSVLFHNNSPSSYHLHLLNYSPHSRHDSTRSPGLTQLNCSLTHPDFLQLPVAPTPNSPWALSLCANKSLCAATPRRNPRLSKDGTTSGEGTGPFIPPVWRVYTWLMKIKALPTITYKNFSLK